MISPVIVSSQILSSPTKSSPKLVNIPANAVTKTKSTNTTTTKDRPKLSTPKDKKPCERLYRSCDRMSKTSEKKTSYTKSNHPSSAKSLKPAQQHASPHGTNLMQPTLALQVEEKRPHSVDLGGLDRWMYVVPGHRTKLKECDERCDEFVRAGIGICLKGISEV